MTCIQNPFDNYYDVFATPLVEIFAVSVCDKNDELSTEKCQVYGKITVTDKLDNTTFVLFNRGQDNPQTISNGQTLLLTPPLDADNAVIIPSEYVSVNVELWDGGGTVIAKGSVTLDRTTSEEEWSEEYLEKSVSGSENKLFAKVHYAIFPYAVTATVSVLYFHDGDYFDYFKERVIDPKHESPGEYDCITYEEDGCLVFANLFGTVSATGVSNGNHSKTAHLSSLLFDKPLEESVCVKSRSFIKLSRSVVAVPGYSSLQIKADFFDCKTRLSVASGALEFKPFYQGTYKEDIIGVDARIRVRVAWNFAHKQLYSKNSQKRVIPVTPNFSAVKRNKHSSKYHSPTVEIDGCIFYYPSDPVFECWLFNQDESSPQDSPNMGTLARIKGASESFSARDTFGIAVDIKDDTGGIISKGEMSHRMLYDRVHTNMRMCSVIRGQTGFTAIHYSFFPDGVSAFVDVKLHGRKLPAIVKGEIYARYSSCESYSRQYQEKLFQSILFYDVPEGVLVDATGSSLPLVKSLVTVPRESYLIIETNLSVLPVGLEGLVQGMVKSFKCKVGFTGNDNYPIKIGDFDLSMELSVKFSETFD